jgi:hypothetical protein
MAELDKGYSVYADMMRRRTGLKEHHIAEGWMRGQGGAAHMRPEDLPRVAGLTDLHILMGDANLSIGMSTVDLDAMIAEWQSEVEMHPDMDPRAFTRRFLYEGMLLNRHREDKGSTVMMLAAVWLVATGPTGDAARALLKRGDCGFYTQITVEQEKPSLATRVRSWIDDYR